MSGPINCSNCGVLYMRRTLDPDAPKLCNNCTEKEKLRTPKPMIKDETIHVLVKLPKSVYNPLEEHCRNEGLDMSTYFSSLHLARLELLNSHHQIPNVIEKSIRVENQIIYPVPENLEIRKEKKKLVKLKIKGKK